MDTIGAINVAVGAKIDEFEAGMQKVQADLGKMAAAAQAASGRYVDAQGRMREANGRFVSASTLAAEAAANVGGSLGRLSDQAQRTATTINGSLVSSFAAYDRAIKPLEAGVGRLGQGMKDVGGSLTTSVTLPLTLAGGAALAAYGKIDSLSRGLNALATQDVARQGATGIAAIAEAADATKTRLAELQEIAKAPGIGFEQAVQGDIRLRAVGIAADQSAKILREFANAISLTGGGAAQLDQVTVQLGQLSAKGKVLSQDLRPIIEAAPAVSQALQKLYGTVDAETISASLAKQGKSSQEFVAILTDELAQLPRVAGGFSNALENALQGGQQNLARLGESLNKAFNLEGLLDRVGNALTRLTDYFTGLSPATQKFILGSAAVAAAAGPIVFGLGAITAAIPSVVAGLEVMGLASTAALGPLGLGVAAVAAAAALIISHWDELVAYFDGSGEGGRLFADLGQSVKQSVEAISAAFGQLKGAGSGTLSDLISASGILKALFRDLAVGVTAVSDVIGGTIGSVSALFRGDFTKSVEEAQRALYGLVDPLANVLGFTKAGPQVSFDEFFKLGDALKAADAAALADAASNNVNTASLAAADDAARKHVVTLKELQKELAAALQVRFNDAQAGRDTTADDAEIARIRALIAEFKQVPAHADAATKAIQRLRAELRSQATLARIFPDPSEFADTQERIKLIENGLKNLVTAGVSPASSAFKAFVTEASTLAKGLAEKLGEGGGLALKPVDIKLAPVTFGQAHPDAVLGGISKELADHPLLVPFELKPPKTDFAGDLFVAQDAISKGFAEASKQATIFGDSFDYGAARVQVLQDALQTLAASGIPATAKEVQNLAEQLRNETALVKINHDATQALASGLSQLGSGLLEGLGQLAVGAITLGDFGATILGLIGKLATQVGEAIVAVGIGMLGLKAAFTNPFGAIAAGAALIVIGSALGAISGSLSSVGGGGGSASVPPTTASSGSTYKPTTAPTPAGYNSTTNTHRVEFVLQGRELRGVLAVDDDKLGRVLGAR